MNYLLLFFAVASSGMLNIVATAYNRKNRTPSATGMYNIIYTTTNFVCWLIVWLLTERSFLWELLPYSVIFALCYAGSLVGLLGALRTGSASLTAFIKQLSLVGVAVWGFFFWDTPFTVTVALGLLFIGAALFFCLMNPHRASPDGRVTAGWLLFSLMLFGGNAFYSVVQKYQQMAFDGAYGALFMCMGSFFAAIFSVLFALRQKPSLRAVSRGTAVFPMLGGAFSCVLNRMILVLATSTLSPAAIYPAVAVGSMAIGILFSVAAYKEQLPRRRWLGLALGAVAVALLNL